MFNKLHNCIFLLVVLLFASCTGSSIYMKSTESLLKPTTDKALIRFMRPSSGGHDMNFNITDGKKVIGNSVAKCQFDYLATPGKHLFIITATNKVFLEADLEAGKTYYVITENGSGWRWHVPAIVIPVNRNSKYWDKVIKYEKKLKKITPNEELLKEWENNNKAKIDKLFSEYETVWKDTYDWPQLRPEDGR